MRRCFELAVRAGDKNGINPLVGALVVRNGTIVGEGLHRGPGTRHAEIEAIETAAAGSLVGATLYCTLEPCCHTEPGKQTPPCVPTIIERGISRVVIAACDPNPMVDGRGRLALERAGVQVDLLEEATPTFVLQNEGYIRYIQSGMPFVHLKVAQTADGCVATGSGDSKWITDRAARRVAHALRARVSAVLIGSGTARRDNPALTVRHIDGVDPVRIVLDTGLDLPPNLRLFSDGGSTVVFCAETRRGAPPDARRLQRLTEQGVEVQRLVSDDWGMLDLVALLQACSEMGLPSLLVEGGPTLITHCIRRRLWDKITLFIAPVLLGDDGIGMVGNLGIGRVADAIHIEQAEWQTIGGQALLTGYRDVRETFGRLSGAFA